MDIFKFINEIKFINFDFTFKEKCLNITFREILFQLILIIDDFQLAIKSANDLPQNILISFLINEKKYDNINQIIEILQFIDLIIIDIFNYCIVCHKKLDFQSDGFITCGNLECVYRFEELIIGNPIIEKIKEEKDFVKFLLESAFDAINSERKFDIFEPFPNYFLKSKINISRETLSKLSGKNYDAEKDFIKINKLIDNFNIEKFFEKLEYLNADQEISSFYGKDSYILLRFIILSCNINLIRDYSLNEKLNDDHIKIYKIVHPIDKEKEFENLNKNNCSLLFHGSNWANWYSILRNGLKNCSKTKLMTAGAAFGNGIYLSDNFDYSYNYGVSGNKSIVGVFEIINKDVYKKSPNIFVVDNEKNLIQRYLLIINTNSKKNLISQIINKLFSSEILQDIVKSNKIMQNKGIKKIITEYKNIKKIDPKKLGFRTEINEQNHYIWNIFIFDFDEKYPIGQDLKRYNIKEIHLEIIFPNNYPMSPPFVRVVTPRFQQLTAHISKGAICNQLLTEKYWSPAANIESVIVSIKSEIIEGDGRIDPILYNIPYTEKEAKDSFFTLVKAHGWM